MWSKWDIKITRWREGTLLKNRFLGDNFVPNTSFSASSEYEARFFITLRQLPLAGHINFKPLMIVHKQGTLTWATSSRFTSLRATARPTVPCFRWNMDPSVETRLLLELLWYLMRAWFGTKAAAKWINCIYKCKFILNSMLNVYHTAWIQNRN